MTTVPDLEWSDLDDKAVDTARVLAMDAVQRVGNGHPGTAMSLAPVAYLLFQKVMRHDPADPTWISRDRFVLSCGHSSITLYTQLFLGGFGLELEDIKALRTWGSKTPGHPELGHTAGVEVTTGPLGQGVANAVGMAMSARRVHGLLDPEAAPGESLFDHHVYALCSDGDLQEGVSSEASSIAGTQQLGNLTVVYDRNRISIEGDTDVAFTEDVAKRYEAYGWHVQTVDWTNGGEEYREDVPALHQAIVAAGEVTDRPSLIVLDTVIAWPAPNAQGTEKAHGSALGDEEVAATKEILGWDPEQRFQVPPEVLEHTRALRTRGSGWGKEWDERYAAWAAANPEREKLLHRLRARELPEGLADVVPTFEADAKGVATRSASGKVINALAPVLPELWGGSADLAGSNNTTIESAPSFIPEGRSTRDWTGDPYQGRVLHFGIREHGMGAIMNGIAADKLTRVFGGTFLTFSDYMRGSVRVAALSQLPVTYVWTHDSIGLGEDGPTHQPIEHLAALRAMPGLDVVRPADANETAAAWLTILRNVDRPAALALTRQNVPVFPRGTDGFATTDDVSKGGYVLVDADSGDPDVILMGTGSEVQLAVEARELLAADGIAARVVSFPCLEWFEEQSTAYRETVLPPTVKARVSVEAGVKQGWRDYVGDHGRMVSIDRYGASADYARIYEEYGVTARSVADAARDSLRVATE
ncbi:transketolase [Nocardioides deserti]|uniref:Transketolase n=1 Tax=Nocardioides deserti TaxID=1588644 RepID=A0ABR6U3V5_9ACTN|nr:transketolase [Nocardioides deserti]MBC2959107.1 transketolase [Nocardioides deserti]GGO68694.1 transketolase [Nocardioides deserti]